MEKKRQAARDRYKLLRKNHEREWGETNKKLPVLKYMPSSSSEFALKVYREVFNTLAYHNIRFKAESNYLKHGLYKKPLDSKKRGLRADLLVKIDMKGRDKL
jgi:hypothetical protein